MRLLYGNDHDIFVLRGDEAVNVTGLVTDLPHLGREDLMAALIGSTLSVFIHQGRLQLGTWQRIFFCEFDGPRNRTLCWKIIAD